MTLLQQLVASIQQNVQKYEAAIEASGLPQPHLWEAEPYALDDPEKVANGEAYQYMSKILADTRAIEAIVTPSRYKVIDTAYGAIRGAAVDTAATLGVSDCIEKHGGSATLDQLSQMLNVNKNKLGMYQAYFIYTEASHDTFQNTRHSIALLKKNGAEFFLSLSAEENAISATGLCKDLTAPDTRDSFDAAKSAFSRSYLHKDQSFLEYMMSPAGAAIAAKVIAGVVPWLNRVTRGGLLYDYPWKDLSGITVVDVGAAPGDSGYDILRLNHNIKWIFQDLQGGIDMMKATLPEDMKEKVDSGQISFVTKDWYEENQSQGELWYLRGVLRELDDDKALIVLKRCAEGLKKTSGAKLVINEILCTSPYYKPATEKSSAVPSSSIPFPQTPLSDSGNLMSTSAVLFFGGKERSYEEMEGLLNQAGLQIEKLYVLRTFTSMLDCVLKA